MSVRIELLNKPISKWTKKEAVIESIKLWAFLAEDGYRNKIDYFGDADVILSDCFLCAYYFEKYKNFIKLENIEVCNKCKCCLRDTALCGFNDKDSAYYQWFSFNKQKPELTRKAARKAAQTILDALKAEYKKITGEEYHD